jgi:hypothetical protein
MHVASAYRPQSVARNALARREDDECIAAGLCAADCQEARLASRILRIRCYERFGVRQNVLDFDD